MLLLRRYLRRSSITLSYIAASLNLNIIISSIITISLRHHAHALLPQRHDLAWIVSRDISRAAQKYQ